MPEYTLINPATGQQLSVSKIDLTKNLRQDRILLQGREHIGIITHRDLVVFTRWCAGKMLTQLKGEPDQSVTHTLHLVDQWLEDEVSLSNEELEAAAHAAWAATGAARAATGAARAARATNAARAASYKAQAQWFVEHLQS